MTNIGRARPGTNGGARDTPGTMFDQDAKVGALVEAREATLAEDGLFEMDAPMPVSLHDRFGMPPFSILDRRSGQWQDRKRRWLSLGIRSELGRDGGLLYTEETGMAQGFIPVHKRSDRALQAMLDSPTHWSEDARRELAARAASGRRVLDGAPPPGGGGPGAWKGRTASGDMRAIDPKWDSDRDQRGDGGTPGHLIPGGNVGGAYDRSRGGVLDSAAARARLNEAGAHSDQDKLNAITGQETLSGTSIFDPVLCELAYRWFTAPGMRVLDPFAGGSVRGIVAAVLQRHYMGVDLRAVQIEANKAQGADILRDRSHMPRWVAGDSNEVLTRAPAESVDFVFSCPPYADLEVYSDDPRDISGMDYDEFLRVHEAIIGKACAALKPDRFAAWVISDVRDKRTGCYRGLPAATVEAFRRAGLGLYNEQVVLDPVGSAAVRASRIFNGMRKTIRMHQIMLVFVKGDPKRATQAANPADEEIVLEVVSGSPNG